MPKGPVKLINIKLTSSLVVFLALTSVLIACQGAAGPSGPVGQPVLRDQRAQPVEPVWRDPKARRAKRDKMPPSMPPCLRR